MHQDYQDAGQGFALMCLPYRCGAKGAGLRLAVSGVPWVYGPTVAIGALVISARLNPLLPLIVATFAKGLQIGRVTKQRQVPLVRGYMVNNGAIMHGGSATADKATHTAQGPVAGYRIASQGLPHGRLI